jgi:3-oxoadipate enol-lactonase
VLIHAGRIDSRMWDEQFELFSKTHQVIRYDTKGYGKSEDPTGKFSDAEDLYAVLQHLDVERCFLVGSSNGGSIAIDFTVTHPRMVQGLVLAATSVSGYELSPKEKEQKVWDGFTELWKREEELVRQGKLRDVVNLEVDTWHQHTPALAKEKLSKMHLENSRAYITEPWKMQIPPERPTFGRLSEIHIPTLILIGDLDVRGIQIMNERLHSMIPDSKKLTIKGADHIMNMTKPTEFNDAVLGFLSGLEPNIPSGAE